MSDTTTSADEQSALQIDVVDLLNAVKIIDYAAEQGAFRGWQTIKEVLSVRDKIDAFANAAAAARQAAEKAASEAAEPVVEEKPAKKRAKK